MPLFEKVLSASDAGRIGRLVLPKACAEVSLEVHFLIWSNWLFGTLFSLFFPFLFLAFFSFFSRGMCKLKVNAGIFSSYFSIRRLAFKDSRCEGE